MSASNHLAVRALGDGPHELVLRCTGAGVQRFTAGTFEALERAINDRAPFLARRRADMPDVVRVDADTLEVVRHSASLDVELVPERRPSAEQLHAEKAARHAALESAWTLFATPERLATLLHGREVHTQNRPSLAWLRATPPTEWPPIFVRWNGERALLMGGCHRVRVARELGIGQIRANVHAASRIVYDGLVGV